MTGPVSLSLLSLPSPGRGEPLSVKLYRDLLAAIRDGRLGDGAALPSSRAGAAALRLSRGMVNAAYGLLRAESAIEVRRGAVPRVISAPTPLRQKADPIGRVVSSRGACLSRDMRAGAGGGAMVPGEPSEALFPTDEWARAPRRAARRHHGAAASNGETDGLPALRRVLGRRLAADRGVAADPDQILVTPGTQASLALAAQVLTDPGDVAGMASPGFPGARVAFHGAGLRIAPVPVDASGARPDKLSPGARLIYLTPSNPYPVGVRPTHARRAAILAQARETGALILEDDYDSEFCGTGARSPRWPPRRGPAR